MRILFLTVISTVLIGCNSFVNEQPVPSGAIGEWQWTHTTGGWGPQVDADTADYTMRLRIYSDEAIWFRDDEIMSEYYLREKKKDWHKDSFFMKRKEKEACDMKGIFNKTENSLVISSAGCTDLPSHYFKKTAR